MGYLKRIQQFLNGQSQYLPIIHYYWMELDKGLGTECLKRVPLVKDTATPGKALD